jgi:hypothetical protein
MLDYVLFDQEPFDLFVNFLKANDISPTTSEKDGIYEIRIPEDMDDVLAEKIEQRYDELMDLNNELFFAKNPPSEKNFSVATLVIDLEDGRTTNAHVRPDLVYRILQVVEKPELDELIAAIVDAVENPDERSYCQKVRDGEVDFNDEK